MNHLKDKAKHALCRVVLMKDGALEGMMHPDACDEALRRSALDWLYIALSVITYIYIAVAAVAFFGRLEARFPNLIPALRVFENTYLAALGVYTVLKEFRKHRGAKSRYWGEVFVFFWLLLLGAATAAVLVADAYSAGQSYMLIVSTSIIVFLIYMGSLIHKP